MTPKLYVPCVICLAAAGAGCATGSRMSYGQSALGHVVASSEPKRVDGEQNMMIPVPIGPGAIMPTYSKVPVSKSFRLYDVRLLSGQVIQMWSERDLAVGACVRARHSSDLSQIAPPFNPVPGVLDPSFEC